MIETLQPPHAHIEAHFALLQSRLTDVSELTQALESANTNLIEVGRVYNSYIRIFEVMANLTTEERATIVQANQHLQVAGGESGSASSVTAVELADVAQEHGINLAAEMIEAINPESEFYQLAVDELVAKLAGGHQFKLAGKTPSDGDPESAKIIWGHTQITDATALVHFLINHYTRCYMSRSMGNAGIDIAKEKDFSINAMVDALIVDHLGDNHFAEIYEVWANPKDRAGVGWISDDRLASYDMR